MIKLAIPVVVVQVGMLLMGLVDTVMVGRLPGDEGKEALATVGIGNLSSFVLIIFGIGVLMALDPVLSQAIGAKDRASVTRNVQRGLVLAAILTVPITLLHLPARPVLQLLQQPQELIDVAAAYVWILMPGVLPMLCFVALRLILQAHSRMSAVVWTIVIANLLNVFLNWLWIYGHWGFVQMGVIGSAWATLVCRWIMAILVLMLGWKVLSPHLLHWVRESFGGERLLKMFRLGAPAGLQLVLEYGAFGGTMLFMGWFGAREQSGNQVAITLATISYMVPLGISFAAAVRVGYGIGAEHMRQSRWAAITAILTVFVTMTVFAALFILMPEPLARLFTANEETLEIAVLLLPIAGIFQIADGLQVVGIGILRGAGDTRAALIANVLGFWITGLPIGLVLARPWGFDIGPQGHWWGLLIGLSVVAAFLMLRVYYRLRSHVERTDI
ncbi:MAG: MATE family efflux transporter [Planctomycetota bacterium]|jgi:MATE family multidrug resistance protein